MRRPKETELECTVRDLLSRMPEANHVIALVRFRHRGSSHTALAPLTPTEIKNYETHPNGISLVLPFGRCDEEPELAERVRQGLSFVPLSVAWHLARMKPKLVPAVLEDIQRAAHQPG